MKFFYKKDDQNVTVNADDEIKHKQVARLIAFDVDGVEIEIKISGEPATVQQVLINLFRVRNPKDQCNAKFTKSKRQTKIDETLPDKADASVLTEDLDNVIDEEYPTTSSDDSSTNNFPDMNTPPIPD